MNLDEKGLVIISKRTSTPSSEILPYHLSVWSSDMVFHFTLYIDSLSAKRECMLLTHFMEEEER